MRLRGVECRSETGYAEAFHGRKVRSEPRATADDDADDQSGGRTSRRLASCPSCGSAQLEALSRVDRARTHVRPPVAPATRPARTPDASSASHSAARAASSRTPPSTRPGTTTARATRRRRRSRLASPRTRASWRRSWRPRTTSAAEPCSRSGVDGATSCDCSVPSGTAAGSASTRASRTSTSPSLQARGSRPSVRSSPRGTCRPDTALVVCRHTLEHIHDVNRFLSMLSEALRRHAPDAALYVEVPDTARILRETAFWDVYYEHCSYFTPGSLARALRGAGFAASVARASASTISTSRRRPGSRVAAPSTSSSRSRNGPAEVEALATRYRETLARTHCPLGRCPPAPSRPGRHGGPLGGGLQVRRLPRRPRLRSRDRMRRRRQPCEAREVRARVGTSHRPARASSRAFAPTSSSP